MLMYIYMHIYVHTFRNTKELICFIKDRFPLKFLPLCVHVFSLCFSLSFFLTSPHLCL